MLDSLSIINHESHKRTSLEFSPGLNIFIGPTDAGKSGAFRAAYLLLNNRPLGNQMIPLYWGGTTEIVGQFSNPDAIVTRTKDTKKEINTYQLNDHDPVNAGAGAPPPEIADAIQMDDVNFQTQVDRAFLMFESPGERGRILNRIAGLDDIDKAIDNSRKDEQKLNREYKAEKISLLSLEEQLETFSDIEKQEERIAFCEGLEIYARKSQTRANNLKDIVSDIKAVDAKLIEAEKLLPAEKQLKQLSKTVREIKTAEERVDTLSKLVSNIHKVDAGLKEAEHLPVIEKKLKVLNDTTKMLKKSEDRILILTNHVKQINKIDKEIEFLEIDIDELESKVPDLCPTCGAEVDE